MRDNNILSRFIKPAARKLGLGLVNWGVASGRLTAPGLSGTALI